MIILIIILIVVVSYAIRPLVNRKREQLIYKMVNDTTTTLTKGGIKTYADFGTLLGAYRDGGVIKNDLDGDIAILREDADKAFNLLKSFLSSYTVTMDPLKIKVWVKGTNIGCDVAIYENSNNNVLTRQTFSIPYLKVFPLKTITWGPDKVPINIPADTEWYLEYQYGPTWKIPRPGDKGKEGKDKGDWNYSYLYSKGYEIGATLTGIPLLFK